MVSRLALVLSVCLLFAGEADARATRRPPTVHTVEAGEYLGAIARRYGVTVDELRSWNELERDVVFPGQSLRVAPPPPARRGARTQAPTPASSARTRRTEPAAPPTPAPRAARRPAEAAPSETAPRPTRRPAEAAPSEPDHDEAACDHDEPVATERPAAPEARGRRMHRVEPGHYLGLLAERYGVTVEDLRTWNELPDDRLRVDQVLVVSPPEAPVSPEALEAFESGYVVQRGDHLTRVAERVGMTVDALRAANPELGERLRPGQRLRLVGATRVVDHVVQRGETLARLAARYEVRHLDMLEWNPSLRRRGLEQGMTVRLYTDVRISRSMSLGAPNEGTLAHPEPLPAHGAYVVRDPRRAFATHETVQWMVEAFDAALDADPDMPRVRVHDLSTETGGPLAGHRSHQSGRDADVAYYRIQCAPRTSCFMSRTGPEDLDAAHQFRLFRYWLERGLVTHIFVDYALQAPLYDYAREHGATEAQLRTWFQYPNGASNPVGIIRHAPSHDDHFHVRFVCPPGDDQCSEATRRVPRAPSLARAPSTHAAQATGDADGASDAPAPSERPVQASTPSTAAEPNEPSTAAPSPAEPAEETSTEDEPDEPDAP